MTHYGEESRVGRHGRGMVNGQWGESGRALTRSRQLTTCGYVANPSPVVPPLKSEYAGGTSGRGMAWQ